MDKQTVIETVVALRDFTHKWLDLHHVHSSDHGEGWNHIQAADWLIEQLKSLPGEQFVTNTDKAVVDLALPYIKQVGQFQGMMEIMAERHPWLRDGQHSQSFTEERWISVGRDFAALYKLTMEMNNGVSTNRGQDHKPHNERPGVPEPGI